MLRQRVLAKALMRAANGLGSAAMSSAATAESICKSSCSALIRSGSSGAQGRVMGSACAVERAHCESKAYAARQFARKTRHRAMLCVDPFDTEKFPAFGHRPGRVEATHLARHQILNLAENNGRAKNCPRDRRQEN